MNGIVRKMAYLKGFGFIVGEDGKDYFFHKDDVGEVIFNEFIDDHNNTVQINVTFEPRATSKGPRAESIVRLFD